MTEFMNALYQGDLSRQMRERSERRRAIGPDIMPAMSGDREALGRVAQQDPDVALKIASTIQGMDVRKAAMARSNLELAGRLASGVLLAPPDQQPTLYASALEQARAMGLDTSKYPTAWGPAAKAWLQHSATMMGSVSSILKRIGGAGAPSGGGTPTGGFGGPRLPAGGAAPPVRTSDATPPTAPPVTLASAPPPAEPPPALPARVAGAGPVGGDLPPMPQIASAALPPVPPAIPPSPHAPRGPAIDDLTDFSWGGAIAAGPQGAPPQADTAKAEMRVQPQRLAMLGADFVAPKDQRAADEFGLAPGEMYGVKKNGEPIVEAGMVLVRTRDRGDVFRRLPKTPGKAQTVDLGDRIGVLDETGALVREMPKGRSPNAAPRVQTIDLGDRIQVLGSDGEVVREIPKAPPPRNADQPKPLGSPAGPADTRAALRGLQLPQGFAIAGVNGQPVVKDGTVMVVGPDGSYDFVPLPQRADAKTGPRYEDVRDDKGRLIGQRRVDTNEYKPIDRNAGGAGRPLGDTDIKSLGAAGTSAQEFVGLRDTFDDSFGGFKYDAVGGIDNFIKRNLPDSLGGADPKGQADWWQRYQTQKNLIRHALFGSALTATEKAEFDKAMIDPGMKPEVIRRNLARQADAAMRAAAKIARAKEASGYNREAIEAALGIPLDTLPSPTAKPAADRQRAEPSVTVPMPSAKPPEVPKGRADDLRRQYGLD